jgi:hypothetical protein
MKSLLEAMTHGGGLDSLDNFAGELPDANLLVVMGRSRDSDLLTESNWHCALEALGGESEMVEIIRYGHWAVGWVETLVVRACSKAHVIAQELCDALESYPVLDDEDFSRRESEEADRVWSDCYDEAERIAYIREHADEFEPRSFGDLLECVRGKYFLGYASELIH